MSVGIALEQVAAPGATPIAFNAAAAKLFANNYAKLAAPNLAARQRITIGILGLIYKLTNAGGADYKSNHKGLIQDAAVFCGAISNLDPVVARAANDWNTGDVADGTLPNDVPTALAEGRDLADLSELELERIIAFLRAQMRT